MTFVNKVVLVTGASSGIGAATAIEFSKEGAHVVMVGRNEEKIGKVATKCTRVGLKPLVVIADVSKDDDAKRIMKETIEKHGKLDILVNNAGFGRPGCLLDGSVVEAYDQIFDTNVRAVIYLSTLATPYLIQRKGNIVNVSSAAAKTTPWAADSLAYFVSKAAVDQFTRGAALELAPYGIRVNAVNPGPVNTDYLKNAEINAKFEEFSVMTALNRISQPEEIANMIAYLAGEKAVGITGSTFVVDNGMLLKVN
ncbi:3-oxoacyl-[acyl-carrier-protein] reductase FabG-like [Pectinophora gossypiella]|uniref:3-oxoacyl-[acyl-carrier-protein] reductase FabG-like n=1 Tax=Pectinophora gossypiella TaxID=13191 RepID=UPI00214F422A|nr:3-oxoacyl-[acyl-carrier-protein] reductase FabG-like [Pectinophora gossypiella]